MYDFYVDKLFLFQSINLKTKQEIFAQNGKASL